MQEKQTRFKNKERNTNKKWRARISLAINAQVTIFAPRVGAVKPSSVVSANSSSTLTAAPNGFTIIFTLLGSVTYFNIMFLLLNKNLFLNNM